MHDVVLQRKKTSREVQASPVRGQNGVRSSGCFQVLRNEIGDTTTTTTTTTTTNDNNNNNKNNNNNSRMHFVLLLHSPLVPPVTRCQRQQHQR